MKIVQIPPNESRMGADYTLVIMDIVAFRPLYNRQDLHDVQKYKGDDAYVL